MKAIQWFSGRERLGRIFNQRTWTSQVKHPINVGYRPTSNAVSLERFDALWNAFYYTNNESVVGDLLEFGVARGRSMVFAWNALHSFNPDIPQPRFYGFESFSGFPAATGIDAVFGRFKAGQEDHGGEAVASAVLHRNGIADSDVTLVPGFYANTLTEENRKSLGIERARVVHLDCDMLMSTKLALDFLSPALQSGTVLLFDDFFVIPTLKLDNCLRARKVKKFDQKDPELVPLSRPHRPVK